MRYTEESTVRMIGIAKLSPLVVQASQLNHMRQTTDTTKDASVAS